MSTVSLHIQVTGLREMESQFGTGARGLSFRDITQFEKSLASSYAAVEAAVHVETGKLKLSVRPSTHFDGEEWEGEVTAARYPGIFELARGQIPTKHRPSPTDHFFFNAVEPILPEFADNVDAVFRHIFNVGKP